MYAVFLAILAGMYSFSPGLVCGFIRQHGRMAPANLCSGPLRKGARGDRAGPSPPSPAWRPQLYGNSFWEGEERKKTKPSPFPCAQELWGFALCKGPDGAQYLHYWRNLPPKQSFIPILTLLAEVPGNNLRILGTWNQTWTLGYYAFFYRDYLYFTLYLCFVTQHRKVTRDETPNVLSL